MLIRKRTRSAAPGAGATERPAVVAMGVSLLLAALKLFGHVLTGSSALLAAAIDSAGDALVSGVSAWTVRFARTPPDAGHPFGHGKVEHLSALFQGMVLAGAAIFVLVRPFLGGDTELGRLREPAVGIAIAVVSIAVPLGLARLLARAGRERHSPALEADAAHYASDYLVNAGVVVAFLCDTFLGWRFADPVIAVIIATAILRLSWQVSIGALSGLMDEGLSREEIQAIEAAIRVRDPEVRGHHDLMTRRSGPNRFVQLHVEIDATRSFRDAHRIVELVRQDIERTVPNAVVTIHADPFPPLADDGESPPAR